MTADDVITFPTVQQALQRFSRLGTIDLRVIDRAGNIADNPYGAGNDPVTLAGTDVRMLDGGAGIDTLVLSNSLNLNNLTGTIDNFESITLGSNVTFSLGNLAGLDALHLPSSLIPGFDLLKVEGAENSRVELAGAIGKPTERRRCSIFLIFDSICQMPWFTGCGRMMATSENGGAQRAAQSHQYSQRTRARCILRFDPAQTRRSYRVAFKYQTSQPSSSASTYAGAAVRPNIGAMTTASAAVVRSSQPSRADEALTQSLKASLAL
eukprot:gene37977-43017_t